MRVACIGLGLMGSRMAPRIARAGYEVRGYDLDPARREGLPDVHPTSSIAEAVQDADFVLLSLPTSDDGLAVALGEGGIAPSARTGALVVDTTTARPADTLHMARGLTEAGIRFVDATVSGNAEVAARGELVVMVGGSDGDVSRARPLLNAIGRSVHHLGPVGAGATTKLIVNHVLEINRAALAEGLVAAERAGLDLPTILGVLRDSAASSRAMDLWGHRMIAGDHDPPNARLRQSLKDARLIVDQADAVGSPVRLAGVVMELLQEGVSGGLAELDNSAVMEVLRRRAGIPRVTRE